ncbi:MAG: ribosome silencing factor [Armatimonadota bacterium]
MHDDDAKARLIAEAASSKRAERPVILDLRGLTPICDYFVICSGRSKVHVRAVTEAIEEAAATAGIRAHHREGGSDAAWVLMDYGDVVVHVFTPETRAYYDLEHLWGDARIVPFEPEAA